MWMCLLQDGRHWGAFGYRKAYGNVPWMEGSYIKNNENNGADKETRSKGREKEGSTSA